MFYYKYSKKIKFTARIFNVKVCKAVKGSSKYSLTIIKNCVTFVKFYIIKKTHIHKLDITFIALVVLKYNK